MQRHAYRWMELVEEADQGWSSHATDADRWQDGLLRELVARWANNLPPAAGRRDRAAMDGLEGAGGRGQRPTGVRPTFVPGHIRHRPARQFARRRDHDRWLRR